MLGLNECCKRALVVLDPAQGSMSYMAIYHQLSLATSLDRA
jgi:hypothetical protein